MEKITRKEFLNGLLAVTSLTLYSCENEIEDSLLPQQNGELLDTFSKTEAKKWFNETYINSFTKKNNRVINEINREILWDNSIKVKNSNDDFLWIPTKTDNSSSSPVLLMWREGEEFIRDLGKHTNLPIAEGFLIYKRKDGSLDGFLTQIAYDSIKHKPGEVIKKNKFTGVIINSNWDDDIQRLLHFKDGKLIGEYNQNTSNASRTQECITYYLQYGYFTGSPCGTNCHSVVFHYYRIPNTLCLTSGTGSGGTGSGGYPYYSGSGSGSDSGGGSSLPSYSSPMAFPYSIGQLQSDSSGSRLALLNRLNEALVPLGWATNILDFSASKAAALIQSLGIPFTEVLSNGQIVKTTAGQVRSISSGIGIIGGIMGGAVLMVSISNNGLDMSEYTLEDYAAALGIIGAVSTGWVAVAAGGAAIGISIYVIHSRIPNNTTITN